MIFYELNTLGDLMDEELCRLEDQPEGLGIRDYYAAKGKPVQEFFPQDPVIRMSESEPGIVTRSLLGNYYSYLIVSSAMKKVIEAHTEGVPIEYLGFSLINHKGRVHSTDYVIVNPLGARDCIDFDASDIQYLGTDIVRIHKRVLSRSKLAGAPNLFRIERDDQSYVVAEPLAEAFKAAALTNVILTEIQQA
jgi:hypothetical protein